MVMKAVKKPIAIEFIQYTRNWDEVEEFLGDAYVGGQTERCLNGKSWVEIKTLDSIAKAFDGDYIIKGTQGEFYPCAKNIFENTYEIQDEELVGYDPIKSLQGFPLPKMNQEIPMPKVKPLKEERLVVYCDDLDAVTKEELIRVSECAEIRLRPKSTSTLSVELDTPIQSNAPEELIELLDKLGDKYG